MSWLSKALKKGKKVLGKVAVNVARTALSGATGGASERVISAAKSLGIARRNKKAQALKIEPLSVRAVIARTAVPSGGTIPQSVATTMPGGAALSRSSSSGTTKRRRKASTPTIFAPSPSRSSRSTRRGTSLGKPSSGKAKRTTKSSSKSAKRSGKPRKAPTGGLDLKALSASWKAAGKPGTWQSWIQNNK